MKNINELLDKQDPAWPLVQSWLQKATNPVDVLPPSDPARTEALVATQVTTRSPMGAIIYETGGILIDHSWIRLLGSGHPRLPRSLPDWNIGRSIRRVGDYPPFLLIADDVIGGFFVINGGAFGSDQGIIYYFAPDTLEWESLEMKHTPFIQWCFSGDVARYYSDYRWPNWEAEVERLEGDKGIMIYPPLFAQGEPISQRHRGVVPLSELYGLCAKTDA